MSEMRKTATRSKDYLWIILFLIIFVNGFESGGYQASLLSIGETYDLSVTSMGLFAALELLADMLAPLLLGGWADRFGKGRSMLVMLVLQFISSMLLLFTTTQAIFLGGMFVLGLTTSALQFIAIAALADAYPLSKGKRIGYLTSMYALGAVASPLIVSFYLSLGISWRALFALLGIGTAIAFIGLRKNSVEPREEAPRTQNTQANAGRFMLWGVLMLCVVMCIYVGFENGFAFFVDTLFTNVFNSSMGKIALSLYWAVMIPSRMLVGRHSEHAYKILLACVIAIPCVAALIAFAQNSALVMFLCVPLGLASGAIYPCSLTLALPFAGKRTATATGMITTATGIGGFAFTALTGVVADNWGMRAAMLVLAAFFVISLLAVLRVRSYSKSMAS